MSKPLDTQAVRAGRRRSGTTTGSRTSGTWSAAPADARTDRRGRDVRDSDRSVIQRPAPLERCSLGYDISYGYEAVREIALP